MRSSKNITVILQSVGAIALLCILNNACGIRTTVSGGMDTDPQSQDNSNAELIFHSGYEGTTYLYSASNEITDIRGIDDTLSTKNDWQVDLEDANPEIGTYRIYLDEGTENERFVQLIEDPTDAGNTVLLYKAKARNTSGTDYCRIQDDMYYGSGFKELFYSVRMYLHPDLALIQNFSERMYWFKLSEFRNNCNWSGCGGNTQYNFRMGVDLIKDSGTGKAIYFQLEAQNPSNNNEVIWTQQNRNQNAQAPIGQWVTLEYYIKEGNQSNGRFYLAMTPDGGQKVVLFDKIDFTHHPDDPNPDGLTEMNPLKMYVQGNVVDYMTQTQGKALQIYWDDLEIWKNRRP